ncbi:hypothetical protein E0H64_13970 [Rhizobium leguminosarum bv. viciae]|uniref:C13 family peptidase n=1 Tax=Rhizobium leguminosarum TaxID=384 RepID=UPI00103EF540|nr:C13 family peptidase [Rhizobium leguminosarum]TBZ68439.1 hypothetical protein E0H64_13970 [Rhizobium leguminosarum bv. viciae]
MSSRDAVLCIGIGKYPASALGPNEQSLLFAAPTALAIGALFHEIWPDAQILPPLIDAAATFSSTVASINAASGADALFLYICGHGRWVKDKASIIFYPEEENRGTVTPSDLGRALAALKCKSYVIFLDTCHSGAFAAELVSLLAAQSEQVFIIASSRPTELSWEDDKIGSTVFGNAVRLAFSELAQKGSEVLLTRDLYPAIVKLTSLQAYTHKRGESQQPVLTTHQYTDLVATPKPGRTGTTYSPLGAALARTKHLLAVSIVLFVAILTLSYVYTFALLIDHDGYLAVRRGARALSWLDPLFGTRLVETSYRIDAVRPEWRQDVIDQTLWGLWYGSAGIPDLRNWGDLISRKILRDEIAGSAFVHLDPNISRHDHDAVFKVEQIVPRPVDGLQHVRSLEMEYELQIVTLKSLRPDIDISDVVERANQRWNFSPFCNPDTSDNFQEMEYLFANEKQPIAQELEILRGLVSSSTSESIRISPENLIGFFARLLGRRDIGERSPQVYGDVFRVFPKKSDLLIAYLPEYMELVKSLDRKAPLNSFIEKYWYQPSSSSPCALFYQAAFASAGGEAGQDLAQRSLLGSIKAAPNERREPGEPRDSSEEELRLQSFLLRQTAVKESLTEKQVIVVAQINGLSYNRRILGWIGSWQPLSSDVNMRVLFSLLGVDYDIHPDEANALAVRVHNFKFSTPDEQHDLVQLLAKLVPPAGIDVVSDDYLDWLAEIGSTGSVEIGALPHGLLPNPRDPDLRQSQWFSLRSPGRYRVPSSDEIVYSAVSLARAAAVATILQGDFVKLDKQDLKRYADVIEFLAKRTVLLDYVRGDHIMEHARESSLFDFLARTRYADADRISNDELVIKITSDLRSMPADAAMRRVRGSTAVAVIAGLECTRRNIVLEKLRLAWSREYEPEVRIEIADVIQGAVVRVRTNQSKCH